MNSKSTWVLAATVAWGVSAFGGEGEWTFPSEYDGYARVADVRGGRVAVYRVNSVCGEWVFETIVLPNGDTHFSVATVDGYANVSPRNCDGSVTEPVRVTVVFGGEGSAAIIQETVVHYSGESEDARWINLPHAEGVVVMLSEAAAFDVLGSDRIIFPVPRSSLRFMEDYAPEVFEATEEQEVSLQSGRTLEDLDT